MGIFEPPAEKFSVQFLQLRVFEAVWSGKLAVINRSHHGTEAPFAGHDILPAETDKLRPHYLLVERNVVAHDETGLPEVCQELADSAANIRIIPEKAKFGREKMK